MWNFTEVSGVQYVISRNHSKYIGFQLMGNMTSCLFLLALSTMSPHEPLSVHIIYNINRHVHPADKFRIAQDQRNAKHVFGKVTILGWCFKKSARWDFLDSDLCLTKVSYVHVYLHVYIYIRTFIYVYIYRERDSYLNNDTHADSL